MSTYTIDKPSQYEAAFKSGLNESQRRDRSDRIGASEIAAVCGLDPFQTPMDVWLHKTNRVSRGETTEAMHFGTVLESVVADEFSRRRGKRLQRWGRGYTHGDHMIAHVDRRVVGERENVQCKTANPWADWIGHPDLPPHYRLQIEQELLCSGDDTEHLACLVGGQQYRDWLDIHPNDNLKNAIQEAAEIFMVRNVKADTPPPPLEMEDFAKLYPRGDNGRYIDCPPNIRGVLKALVEAKADYKTLRKKVEDLSFEVKEAIGENAGFEGVEVGKPAVTWKATKRVNRDYVSLSEALATFVGSSTGKLATYTPSDMPGVPSHTYEASLVPSTKKLVDGLLLHIEANGDDIEKDAAQALVDQFTKPPTRTFLTKPKVIVEL